MCIVFMFMFVCVAGLWSNVDDEQSSSLEHALPLELTCLVLLPITIVGTRVVLLV